MSTHYVFVILVAELLIQNSLCTFSFIISDVNGRILAQPLDEKKFQIGRHQVCLDHHALNLSPGIYLATISTSSEAFSRKFEVVH